MLHLDMKDEVPYAALVVRLILDRLAAAGIDGQLAPRREPPAPFPYDAKADLYTGMDRLAALDQRGLPPGFPDHFPEEDSRVEVPGWGQVFERTRQRLARDNRPIGGMFRVHLIAPGRFPGRRPGGHRTGGQRHHGSGGGAPVARPAPR